MSLSGPGEAIIQLKDAGGIDLGLAWETDGILFCFSSYPFVGFLLLRILLEVMDRFITLIGICPNLSNHIC